MRAVFVAAVMALGGMAWAQPPDLAGFYRESYRLEATGNYRAAYEHMRALDTAGSYLASVRLGWLGWLAGEHAASAAAYRVAIERAPKSIEARLGLTLPLLAQADWAGLEKACQAVLTLDPQNAVARARLGAAHYNRGNYPDAATVYRKLVEQYPAELDHQTGLGWALLRMGRRDEARKLFSAVLAVSPDNASALAGHAAP